MKANNGSGNNESRDEWQTPRWLFDILNKQYNFKVDCCANQRNKKTIDYSDDFERYTRGNIKGAWMNPPFSKADVMFKTFFRWVKEGIAIYRCDNMETKIWQETIFPNATWIFIPNKRIVYEGMKGNGSRFPSALIGLNVKPIKKLGGITLTPSLHSGNGIIAKLHSSQSSER